MAKTLAIGLTTSGTEVSVNEDTFSFDQHIYPDSLTGGEEKSASSSLYTQLFAVTQGFGGPGAGDLAGRIFQRAARDMIDHIGDYKTPEFDFKAYANDLLTLAHARLRSQMARRTKTYCVSFAMLLIDANTAYVMNVGETALFLFRQGRLLKINESTDAQEHEGVFLSYASPSEGELPDDALRADLVPEPNALKRFSLKPGDILLMTSSGFLDQFYLGDLARDLAAPDAFAATIRQANIDSGERDRKNNRTVLAVKVRDLSLEQPRFDVVEQPAAAPALIQHAAHAPAPSTPPSAPQREREMPEAGRDRRKTDERPQPNGNAKQKMKKPLKTFLLSLLAGFLVGLAAIMVIWYILLH